MIPHEMPAYLRDSQHIPVRISAAAADATGGRSGWHEMSRPAAQRLCLFAMGIEAGVKVLPRGQRVALRALARQIAARLA